MIKQFEEFINEATNVGETLIHFTSAESAALFFCEYSGQISDGKYENAKPNNHWKWVLNVKGVIDGKEYYEGNPHMKKYTFGDWDKYIKKGLAGNPDSSWGFTIRAFDTAKLASILPQSEVLSMVQKEGYHFTHVAEAFGDAVRDGKSWDDIDIEKASRFTEGAKVLINQKNFEAFANSKYDFKDYLMARVSCEESINTFKPYTESVETDLSNEINESSNSEKQILNWCKTLAKSQGLYGRLYDYLTSNSGKDYLEELVSQNFNEMVDFVMYVEN